MNQPYFANQPKQFPQRQQQQPPRAEQNVTTDPQYQLICPCGGELFDHALALFRVPGMLVGTTDITFAQCFSCRECGKPLVLKDSKTRQELAFKEGA